MPTYSATALQTSLYPQQIGASFGYIDALSQAKSITSAARVSNVITFTLAAAGPWAVGDTIVVTGTTPAGATSFNGTFTVATVPTGVTLTVASTAADDTATGGTATGDSIYEPMPAVNTAGTAFSVAQAPYGAWQNGRAVTWRYEVVTAPGAITVVLQGGMTNAEADFVTVATATTVGGATTVSTGLNYPFYRLKITTLTLTNGAGLRGRIEV